MTDAKGRPDKHNGQGNNGQKPVENHILLFVGGDECKTQGKNRNNPSSERTASFISVVKEARSITLFGKRTQQSRRRVHGSSSHRSDRVQNHRIDNVRHNLDPMKIGRQHIWRGTDRTRTQKTVRVIWHKQANNNQGTQVKENDTEENKSNGRGQSCSRVAHFRDRQGQKFSTTHGERGSGETLNETFERYPSTRVSPVFTSNVSAFGGAEINAQTHNEETSQHCELERVHEKFSLTVTTNTEQVDETNDKEENHHKHIGVDGGVPVFNGHRSSHQL